ncbi:MAG TPA: beta-aspartyl-peptidase [Clostridium sp.]|jgi:beta-aspartyl-dipeptidase (metallo-type)|uniref:Isoaspartyl dipeptidase n=1 Tax=Clostridium lapidicellarium TaxID=3240931 RepID=A0ABV4DX38_9CLOT|nr:beta-aspartyl-peptidase [uncultured Clostridium sp.]NLU07816.1 beta-aspartyl-peptidase [Clostridiales bacterium]HBC96512.1 beta-aspartyl-peptidase [Clostridium sp.]
MLLIKNVDVFDPEFLGKKNIFICFDKIAYISKSISIPSRNFPEVKILDGTGLKAVPGLIDLHVHINGGGGEGGFKNRTPELNLTDLTSNGVTTCVGLLGTDGITRNMGGLLAKAKALQSEGITTYCWTGCYDVPTRTLTNSVRSDIVTIDKIIGAGEIAVSDHRGSHPSDEDLIHLACETRVGGLISGKCGVLHMHMGDGKKGLTPVFDIVEDSDMPFENLLPTHLNRNKLLSGQCIEYLKMGGFIDITTGIKNEGDDAVSSSQLYQSILKENISPYHITMSSDAGGSMPFFDKNGKLTKLTRGMPSTDMDSIRESIESGVPMELALIPLTASPARFLKFPGKGKIAEGCDADLILLDDKLNINTVVSRGKIMVQNYKPTVYGTFENK